MATNPKGILLLFSSSEIGGAERSLSRMAFKNSNKSLSYQLATFGPAGSWSKWVESKSIECHCFNYKTSLLLKHINLHKPDVIYIIGFRLSVLLRLYCKIFTKSSLVQGVRWNPSSKSKLDKSFRFVERVFSFMLDGYIVNSKSAEKVLNSISKNKVEVIYNGISYLPDRFIDLPKKNYVITVANLSERKGYKEYIKVIQNIVKQLPEVQFIFLGYDNLNGQIQKLIKRENLSSNIKYLGFQENVGTFLNESSIFVLPSLYGEGCPTSILEAFTYKLPVVAYAIDGIPELVSHNVDGVLVDTAKSNSLEYAIKDLLLDPVRVKKMGENGFRKVNDNFSLTNMLEKHNSFFLDLN